MMITAGKFKGRKVKTPKSSLTRPTSSKVRESIFNITCLKEAGTIFYEGATHFLDVFAGSGIMGLEAFSRGAEKVVFIEKSGEAVKLLKQNISAVNSDKTKLLVGDSIKFLDKFKENEFNFIYVDPPYQSGLYEPVLQKISQNNILAKDGIIILEHDSKTQLTDTWAKFNFELYKTKIYGDTAITVLTV